MHGWHGTVVNMLLPGKQSFDSDPQHPLASAAGIAVRMEECHVGSVALSPLQLPLLDPHVPRREDEGTGHHHEGHEEEEPYEYQWKNHQYAKTSGYRLRSCLKSNDRLPPT